MPCNAGWWWCGEHKVVHRDGEKEYCVFHAPKNKKFHPDTGLPLSGEEFNGLVFAEIEGAIREKKRCYLSGTVFPGDISFGQYDKKNPLPEMAFTGATFGGEADFGTAKFNSWADFGSATFTCRADFTRATFSGEANFFKATFSGEAHFIGVTFTCEAYFIGATFICEADFTRATFGGESYFEGETFKDGASAVFVDLKVDLKFERKGDEAGLATFNGVRMRKPSFLGTDLNKCQFISCQWDEEDGRNKLYDEDVLNKKEEEKIGEIRDGEWPRFKAKHLHPVLVEEKRQVQSLYRKMKQKYKLSHDEFEASKWHASEKEMQRRATGIDKFFDWMALNLYRLSSGYGEYPTRAAKTLGWVLLAAIIAMGVVGLSPEVEEGFRTSRNDRVAETIYLLDNTPLHKLDLRNTAKIALTTFEYLTFQKSTHYGLKPAGPWGAGIKIVFLLLVYTQFTLFLFALRNRFRR